jgi:hypothetical protein
MESRRCRTWPAAARIPTGRPARLCHHVRGRVLAAGKMIVEQRLDLGDALSDFPCRIIGHPFLPGLLRI